MKIKEITKLFESVAPLSYQESYDNCGLQIGNPDAEIKAVLLTIDVTEEVVDEAISIGANLIIAHHPLIFAPLKKITGANYVERSILKAIKNDIAIYAAHTNFDSITGGVNSKICEKLELKNCSILSPVSGELKKLVFFVPVDYAQKVREAIFTAGAGQIGNYDMCSFNIEGNGTFRAGAGAEPFTGKIGMLHSEAETRVETIFPKAIQGAVLNALLHSHPYEEVAYDIYPLDNKYKKIGMGMIGKLEQETDTRVFLEKLKNVFLIKSLKHSAIHKKTINKIAVCGGSGSFLIKQAISANADIFITGDVKYHNFFDAENKIIIVDAGHFETEQFTKEIFYDLLIKNFNTFAVHFSEKNINPINYL
ncbi:MAG: Nif3-like dinuclear metal center hexameric protein [Bacteroidetes bacterium RIFOXYA12_FULL_35_11]|nr:MAG: Nif3-like dinuclear metal center hexameric protein [Bacteroidetes bacterium GWF2_35_48]OFY72456.1 MAG: Nif3-like dinuclear metal center hexameric protein [Bacteroidetes bacterium RIFOXYA12_FULL_35_11]OFY97419.1 MAG: Nif3-like dinuclear metal center hexameric protein [Bacteroidetes bacterium RIFOXYB2_FULL_35_7]HBX50489.1 Nif3-like dinuclear metal center hexameric protein [Bacteroidales bacterium]